MQKAYRQGNVNQEDTWASESKVVYVPFEDKSYGRLAKFNGKSYLPTRYVGHWKEILGEVRRAGFKLKLIRYKANNSKDFCGTLTVGAVK